MTANFNLNNNEYSNQCGSKDVISFQSKNILYLKTLFELVHRGLESKVKSAVITSINQNLQSQCNPNFWLGDGEDCEILKTDSSGWQTGKIKIQVNLTLEFVPDKPEESQSPLDDIRQIKVDNTNPN